MLQLNQQTFSKMAMKRSKILLGLISCMLTCSICLTLMARTAVSLNQYVLDQGITSKLTNWDSDDANVKEILFGKSKFFPEEAISGIDSENADAENKVHTI